jgi:hypothetical protein
VVNRKKKLALNVFACIGRRCSGLNGATVQAGYPGQDNSRIVTNLPTYLAAKVLQPKSSRDRRRPEKAGKAEENMNRKTSQASLNPQRPLTKRGTQLYGVNRNCAHRGGLDGSRLDEHP